MSKFEVGKQYVMTFSMGGGTYPYKCIKRTDKTVWLEAMFGKQKEVIRTKIHQNKEGESAYPTNGGTFWAYGSQEVKQYWD